jgi:hypothetical protein
MADLEGVTAQIRFHLSQMSAKNQQHELERLAFHLARATVTANVLPATGPVQAGGDQGRDFETFRSHLGESDLSESAFAARVSGLTIGFGCSLESEKTISSKIKKDVNTITASGVRVDEIHYYCEANLDVSKRHKLQDWAKESKEGLHLEIHDGQAMASELSNEETFWIAQRFLGVPAEIYPRSAAIESDEWYGDVLTRWKDDHVEPVGTADFQIVRKAARHALAEIPQDVPFWIGRLVRVHADSQSPILRRRVATEIIALAMRSSKSLAGYEEIVRDHFADVETLTDTLDLSDAATAIAYVVGSVIRRTCKLSDEEVLGWQDGLVRRVDALLEQDNGTNRRAELLDISGTLRLPLGQLRGQPPLVDDALRLWMRLTELLPEAPLFNLSHFADVLTHTVVLIGDHPQYRELTSRVEDELEKRMGAIAVGYKARDRAIALYEAGRVLRAIEELHRVKVQWLAKESMEGAILALLLLATWYHELGLEFAAKYYALAAVRLSVTAGDTSRLRERVGPALVEVTRADFGQGAFAAVLGLIELTAVAFRVATPVNGEMPDRLRDFVLNLAMIEKIAHTIDEATGQAVSEIIGQGFLADTVDVARPVANARLGANDINELWTRLETSGVARPPFADVGAERTVAWQALGITWNIRWPNEYAATATGEEFCAILQITLADLAGTGADLCLLPTTVDVYVSVERKAEPHLRDRLSNAGRIWDAVLPPLTESGIDFQELQTAVIAMATTILRDCSVLPHDRFMAAIEDAFRRGITMKTFVARPYHELYQEVVRESDFAIRDKIPAPRLDSAREMITIRCHSELSWNDGPGPTYTREEAEEQIRTRYARTVPPIRETLRRLRGRKTFHRVVDSLRSQGWRDWHILTAMLNVAVNYRTNLAAGKASMDDFRSVSRTVLNSEETKDDAQIPVNEFSEAALTNALQTSWLTTLKNNGLEIAQRTPDFPAIERLLAIRYRYWIDDVPHPELF